jgi:hypothetical protein
VGLGNQQERERFQRGWKDGGDATGRLRGNPGIE